VDSISEAERLVGAEVRIPIAERTPLEPGEFFQSELMGCEVIDRRTGESLGRVEGWEDSGGAGLLAVEGGLLIPFARSICVEIEPAARRIVVELPEGLKDLNRS
jgi:16S rRNA processing protein RimM